MTSISTRLTEYRTYETADLKRFLHMLQRNTKATGVKVDNREEAMTTILKERGEIK
jgi:hypothetical protein